MPPRDEAVVERGGGGQYVVGVGRYEGGREGGGVVREEVSRRGFAGAVDGAVDGVASGDVGGEALEELALPRNSRIFFGILTLFADYKF